MLFALRLMMCTRACLLSLLLIANLSAPLLAQEKPPVELRQIQTLLNAGEDGQAKQRIVAVLTVDFAKRHPSETAALVRQLSDVAGRTRDWRGIYAALAPLAEPLIEALQGSELDDVLADVGIAAGMARDFDAQDRWTERAVSIARQEAGEKSQRALKARANAAYSLLNADRDAEALRRMLDTLNAMETSREAGIFFNTAGQAGDAFYRLAGPESAKTVLQRALDSPLVQTDTGPGKGFLWFNAGVFLRDIGDYDGAIRLQQRAMNLLFRHFGDGSREGLSAYDGLAQTLQAAGNLPAAEAAYRYVYDESLKALGENDPAVWRIANNLAAVLRALKLPADALSFDKFAYNKRFHELGGGANDTVISVFNMAQDLVDAGRWKEAGETFAAIARITAGPRYDARYREAIARWRDYAAYRSGEKVLSREAIEKRELLVDGMDIEQWLTFLDLHADRAEELGWHDRALALRSEALQRAQRRFGVTHPASFEAALDRARLLERVDQPGAVAAYRTLDRAMFDWTRANVRSSGSLAGAFAARVLANDMRGSFVGFATRNAEAAEAYAASLDQWKTLASHAERGLRHEAETTEDVGYKRLIETYLNATGRLREIVTVSLFTHDLMPLDQKMREARSALNAERKARGRPPVASWIENETADFEAAARPKAGDVVIEFSVTYHWQADHGRQPTELAIHAVASRHDRPPEVAEIGRFPIKRTGADLEQGKAFGKKTAALLAEWGKDASTLTLVPDDFLFQNPFAEMRLEDGKRLGEAVNLRMATSRQAYDFRDKHDRFAKGSAALLVGGLVSADDPDAPELPASADEVQSIAILVRENGSEAHVLQGTEGTETRVRAASVGPAILHLATHGFYEAEEDAKAQLYNSGFTLARAQGAKRETEADNVVYARELLGWNLRGVDLVVIAACDTALGDLGLTSTLRGLPLALSVAGARRALLTVDKVPDSATARFMTRFYEHLVEDEMPYADAFNATKRDAWAGRIDGVGPEFARAFIMFEN
jgi:hypothetical protein